MGTGNLVSKASMRFSLPIMGTGNLVSKVSLRFSLPIMGAGNLVSKVSFLVLQSLGVSRHYYGVCGMLV